MMKYSEQKGYSLKKRKLKDWIYDNGRTQPYMARKLGITKSELQRKLNEHELFNEDQIRSLVYLVGAEAAINIIYFPRLKKSAGYGERPSDENEKRRMNKRMSEAKG